MVSLLRRHRRGEDVNGVGNKFSQPLLCPSVALLQRQWRGWRDLFRSTKLTVHVLSGDVVAVHFSCGYGVGCEYGGWWLAGPGLPLPWRLWPLMANSVQELQRSEHSPGQWATANGSFYFDSYKSQRVMGPLQLMGMLILFFSGGGWQRGGQSHEVCDIFFVRVFCVVWLLHLYPCPISTWLYLYVFMYVPPNL